MSDRKSVHVLYKNLGETPNECILRFKKDNPEYADEAMTYAGRLDPMAEGVLIVLSHEELQNKDKYLNLQKTYEFEILWGFETDTLDVLGLVSSGISFPSQVFWGNLSGFADPANFSSLKKIINGIPLLFSKLLRKAPKELMISTKFPNDITTKDLLKNIGKFEQSYPAYSSKPVDGKPLFQWARECRLGEIEIPKHEVEIFEIEYLSRRTLSKQDLLKEIEYKISLVSGDFRQEEILERWKKVLNDSEERDFVLDKISATVSSGFYIRQFVCDLAKSFDTHALTFHIKRTKVGDYS
ncbi:MAG: hypothetical protein ABL917_01060 [Parcubacteria group bacterium]